MALSVGFHFWAKTDFAVQQAAGRTPDEYAQEQAYLKIAKDFIIGLTPVGTAMEIGKAESL
ncbi:MAG: hypothetical protein LBG61_04465, partial [Burkholderiales bacterium]|nr:hypothetical protein [Burkholderiales bacterium]